MTFAQKLQTWLASIGYYAGAIDGQIGPKTQAAIALVARLQNISSFADPADVLAYHAAIAEGKSEEEALDIGDNGIGAWGDSTVQGSGPSCALPPECIIAKWGSLDAGRMKQVIVWANGKTATALLKDTMPHLSNITDPACLDANPDLITALGLTAPAMAPGAWAWS